VSRYKTTKSIQDVRKSVRLLEQVGLDVVVSQSLQAQNFEKMMQELHDVVQ
jgi:hypothetical protein